MSRKSEKAKAIEAEAAGGEEGLVGKDIVRLDLSVLATSPRGKSGGMSREEIGRRVSYGHAKAKRERLKAKKAERAGKVPLLNARRRMGWVNRKPRPWRVRDNILVAIEPDRGNSLPEIQQRSGSEKHVVAGNMYQHLSRAGFVTRERIRTIPPEDRFVMKTKGHEVEWWLTPAGVEEREKILAERLQAELDELLS